MSVRAAGTRTPVALDCMGYHTPDLEASVGSDEYRVEGFVRRNQPYDIGAEVYAFEGKLPVETAYRKVAVGRLERAVNYEQVAGVDAFIYHRIAAHLALECRCRMAHNLAVQVDVLAYVVLCRRGEAGLYALVGIRKLNF